MRERRECPGFGPWSVEDGVVHVEPPFDVIEDMITIRAHLDDCADDNPPLLVVPCSHRLGRVAAGETATIAHAHGHAARLAAAGDLWIYATSIVHASERARNPQRRRVLQVDYASGELPGGLQWLGITGPCSPD